MPSGRDCERYCFVFPRSFLYPNWTEISHFVRPWHCFGRFIAAKARDDGKAIQSSHSSGRRRWRLIHARRSSGSRRMRTATGCSAVVRMNVRSVFSVVRADMYGFTASEGGDCQKDARQQNADRTLHLCFALAEGAFYAITAGLGRRDWHRHRGN